MLEFQGIKSCIRKSENNEKEQPRLRSQREKFQIDISLRIV